MSTSTSNLNPKITTLDITIIRENLNYLAKFELLSNIAQYINTYLIFYDVYIDDPINASDIELNSWVLNYLKSYQLSPTLVIQQMLKVFYDKFYGWEYTEFSKLDRNIRGAFKETFIAKEIYISTHNGHIN